MWIVVIPSTFGKNMKIDYIETDQYSLGILGRSGTRSFANFISRYYFDYAWEQHRNLIIGKDNPDLMFPTHHPYTQMTIDDFNQCNYFFDGHEPTIMVLRDPLERAKSGSRISYEPEFHGAPALTQIEWEHIDYVIPFEDIKMYIGESRWSNMDIAFVGSDLSNEEKALWELTRGTYFRDIGVPNYENLIEEWSVEDYDYTDEIDCYNQIVSTKKQLPPDMWHQMVRDTTWCNIPSKHLKQMN
jgi:hypothetical protein